MPTTAVSPEAVRERRDTRRQWPSVAVATVAIGSWVTSALVMSTRGLDLTDESFYLLSYRWWESNPQTFSGAQYLYGPLFSALGHDIPALRVARLVLLLAAHAAFIASLRDHLRRTGRPAWASSSAVMLLTLACGGISYGWLPQAPGYNDVALLGSLLIGAAALRCATAQAVDARPPVLSLLVAGISFAAVALAKWSSALAVAAFTVVVLVTLLRRTPARLLQVLVTGLVGVGAFALFLHVAVAPWDEVLPPMRAVNRLVSADTNSPVALLWLYASSTTWVLVAAGLGAAAGVVPALIVRRLDTGAAPGRAVARGTAIAGAPVAAALPWVVAATLPRGGAPSAWTYTVSLLGALLAGLVSSRLLPPAGPSSPRTASRTPAPPLDPGNRPDRGRARAVLLLLVVLPAAQAFGTGNPLYLLAIHGLVFWVAATVLVLADSGREGARDLVTSALTTCAVLVALVASTGLLLHPYRSIGVAGDTAAVPGSDNLERMELDPGLAGELAALADAVDEEAPEGIPVYAVDELAGLVLAADRPPAGEAWNSRLDRERAAAGMLAYCTRDPAAPAPVILTDRPLGQSELETLQSCGWPLYAAYRALPPSGGPDGVRVYVPDPKETIR